MKPLVLDSIICGDNVATMRTFPDECIDLTVTSPPYGNIRAYSVAPWDFDGVSEQLWRVTKHGGVVVWVVMDQTDEGTESGESFSQALAFKGLGFNLHDTMIWLKSSPYPNSNRYWNDFEFMFVFSKGKPKTTNLIRDLAVSNYGQRSRYFQRERRKVDGVYQDVVEYYGKHLKNKYRVRTNAWAIEAGGNKSATDPIAHGHSAVMHEQIARDHIRTWSNAGDVVLDPFSGAGTTAHEAHRLGRRYIGVEIDPEACEISRKRIKERLPLDFGEPDDARPDENQPLLCLE